MITRLELRRQALHLVFGVFLITMLYFGWFNLYHMIAILVAGVILSRLCRTLRVPLASWVMDRFEREEYRKTMPGRGPIFFMMGSIAVLYFFPLKIALASMVMLAVGDAMSHVVGKILSKKTYKYLKSVRGTIAGITFSFLGALLFVDVALALWGSVITMGLEGVKINVEDNFYIPIVASIVMSLRLLF